MATYRERFELKIYQSSGVEFQDFFCRIMAISNANFKRVKSHGAYGDGGNDGWIPERQAYYQCFSPEVINSKKLIDKLRHDFENLYESWFDYGIREYYFVVNDRFNGVPKILTDEMDFIKREYDLKSCEIITADSLWNSISELSERTVKEIIPEASHDLEFLNYLREAGIENRDTRGFYIYWNSRKRTYTLWRGGPFVITLSDEYIDIVFDPDKKLSHRYGNSFGNRIGTTRSSIDDFLCEFFEGPYSKEGITTFYYTLIFDKGFSLVCYTSEANYYSDFGIEKDGTYVNDDGHALLDDETSFYSSLNSTLERLYLEICP